MCDIIMMYLWKLSLNNGDVMRTEFFSIPYSTVFGHLEVDEYYSAPSRLNLASLLYIELVFCE